MLFRKKLIFQFFFFHLQIFIPGLCISQQVTWGFNIGASQADITQRGHLDAVGNIYMCGEFSGINVDFDPSAGNALHSSNGFADGFLAKYSNSGQYLLSITIGGGNLDKINAVATDAAGNMYITGFFRGNNIDFDPSAGTAFLSSNGDAGGDPGYGGDIFVAKYNSAGQYVWAFNIGGALIGDNGLAIKCDGVGNIYVGGYFRAAPDFDPSGSTAILDASFGTAFLASYNSNGQYRWAFNFGAGNTDNSIFDIKIDPTDNVYITGYFQGTNIDFDPSVGTAMLSSAGSFEGFVAKYSSAGQYLFAFKLGGPGIDVGRGIDLDNAGNIYVVGDFQGSNIDFDPSAATALLSSNGSADVFVAKYTGSGQYLWAFNAGSGGSEIGWDIVTDGNSVFITGGFSGVADFDPSPTVDNLTSNGGADIFLAKYTSEGVYQCAFSIGSASDDYGFDVQIDGNDRFYLVGGFQGNNVDFSPTPSNYNLSSSGSFDAFMVKYFWPPNTLPTGEIMGDTICINGTAQITFTAYTGSSPFTIAYTDGTNNFIQNNVQSGVPFSLQVSPFVTTVYSVTMIQDAVRCSPINNSPGLSTTIVVDNPLIQTNNDTTICLGGSIQFNTTGASSYSWSPTTGLSDPLIANPVATPASSIQYVVTGTTANGCTGNDTVNISFYSPPVITISNDTLICKNSSIQLFASGGSSYNWTPVASLDDPNIATPVASPIANTTYYVTITDVNTCQHLDSVQVNFRPDPVFTINNPTIICLNDAVSLLASGGDSYVWFPSVGLNFANIPNPIASPAITTVYSVTITESTCNQSQTLNTTVTVNPLPQVSATKSNDIDCSNDKSQLSATGALQYSWLPVSTLNNPGIANPIATPTATTLYTVEGVDANGCSGSAVVSVEVLAGNKGNYLMPTAFTPNKDGLNDCYRVSLWGVIENIEFSIYNRWGQRVFFTRDPLKCWDGTFKGIPQDPGVFVYMVKANTSCEKDVFRKGTFVLIR